MNNKQGTCSISPERVFFRGICAFYKKFHSRNKGAGLGFVSFFILLLALPPFAAAEVIIWEVTPKNPVVGDILKINGIAAPKEELNVLVTFEREVPVSWGTYNFQLDCVEIQDFNNLFTVEAEGVEDLNVRAKLLLWVSKSSQASGDIATVSQAGVPPGTYTVLIDGNAKRPFVRLKLTVLQKIKANSKGKFSYEYETKYIPPGRFEVALDESTKEVLLSPENYEAQLSDLVFGSEASPLFPETTPSEKANSRPAIPVLKYESLKSSWISIIFMIWGGLAGITIFLVIQGAGKQNKK